MQHAPLHKKNTVAHGDFFSAMQQSIKFVSGGMGQNWQIFMVLKILFSRFSQFFPNFDNFSLI